MLGIVILPHFFHLRNMLPDNLNKICVRILTLLLAFSISVLLTLSSSVGISSDFIWTERKYKKVWIQGECLTLFFGLSFWAAFKHSFAYNPFLEYLDSLANFIFFGMSSSVVQWRCAYSALHFDGSRHGRIILVAGFLGLYLMDCH